jgi:hypothetical protein
VGLYSQAQLMNELQVPELHARSHHCLPLQRAESEGLVDLLLHIWLFFWLTQLQSGQTSSQAWQ